MEGLVWDISLNQLFGIVVDNMNIPHWAAVNFHKGSVSLLYVSVRCLNRE